MIQVKCGYTALPMELLKVEYLDYETCHSWLAQLYVFAGHKCIPKSVKIQIKIFVLKNFFEIQIEWWRGDEAVQTDDQNIEVAIDHNKYDTNMMMMMIFIP